MAQDFHAAFQVNGADDTHINIGDEAGVALAAIQGLNQKLEETRAENAELKQELAQIKQLLTKLSEKNR
jgi:cell division protein FtsB